jgi:hypothetical protein
MFGDTITFTINAIPKVLNKINQDGYGAEYLLREATGEFRAKISHTVEKNAVGTQAYDRHYVDLKQVVYATSTDPETVREMYTIIRAKKADVVATHALFDVGFTGFLTSGNITKLLNWES